jgi:threonine/homoserine/homoserine lactone efflux protein
MGVMDFIFLLRGFIFGISIAAPVGPIGVLCINRTLSSGRAVGIFSGLGAATADGFYGFVAAFGLTFITNLLVGQQIWLNLFGGLFLCFLGIRTFFKIQAEAVVTSAQDTKGLWGAYVSTLFLTLTNPLTILVFTAIFAGMGIADVESGYLSAALLVLGVFLGSGTWWFMLAFGVDMLRSRLDNRILRWVNRVSGIVILGFGLLSLIKLLQMDS